MYLIGYEHDVGGGGMGVSKYLYKNFHFLCVQMLCVDRLWMFLIAAAHQCCAPCSTHLYLILIPFEIFNYAKLEANTQAAVEC